MKKWTVCENHAGWYVEGVAPNGGAIAVSAFGIPENEARLIVSNHDLQEQVRILREALNQFSGVPHVHNCALTTDIEALRSIVLGFAMVWNSAAIPALEATKEGA